MSNKIMHVFQYIFLQCIVSWFSKTNASLFLSFANVKLHFSHFLCEFNVIAFWNKATNRLTEKIIDRLIDEEIIISVNTSHLWTACLYLFR